MVESTFDRAERIWFNALQSHAAVIGHLADERGMTFARTNHFVRA